MYACGTLAPPPKKEEPHTLGEGVLDVRRVPPSIHRREVQKVVGPVPFIIKAQGRRQLQVIGHLGRVLHAHEVVVPDVVGPARDRRRREDAPMIMKIEPSSRS